MTLFASTAAKSLAEVSRPKKMFVKLAMKKGRSKELANINQGQIQE